MISAVAVAVQFAMASEMNYAYALIFGVSTIGAAYIGIKSVQIYISQSGKESIIALMLLIVLSLALISIPLKYLLTNKTDEMAEDAPFE